MDSFRGSIPPNFISFRLENQTTEVASTPADPPINVPTVNPPTEQGRQVQDSTPFQETPRSRADDVTSTRSADSDPDVNAYAENMVRQLEGAQVPDQPQGGAGQIEPAQDIVPSTQGDPPASSTAGTRRASTPLSVNEGETPNVDLSAQESALRVVESSDSQLAEFVDVDLPGNNTGGNSPAQQDTEVASSVGDAPPLPGGEFKVRYLTDPSGDEGATYQSSVIVPVALYGRHPFSHASETEGGDETGSELLVPGTSGQTPGQSSTQKEPPHLSGRSRAILKEYFDESPSTRFPVGQTTVTFTEPQVYHLLRVLTDETLGRSVSTMERMVIDAVRGKPTVAPSRTAPFYSGRRAQTPGPGNAGDSSGSDKEGEATLRGKDTELSSSGETGDSSYYGKSDSATEMDLIPKSFKRTTNVQDAPVPQSSSQDVQEDIETDAPEYSSQDATLLEVRNQALGATTASSSKSMKKKGNKSLSKRGVPMREEFFSKIEWTRSFISGPADPLHNPHMVWCHICRKNVSIKSKGPYEILRHHRTERHLRRDQRWRYEHLRSTDPITGKTQHRVRGGNGKLLTKVELAKELPKFKNVELVDIGERFPFYEDLVKGSTTALVTPEARIKTQLRLVGDFIKTQGDMMVLRNLWSRMGSFTNHQATFNDFDWGEDRLSVSTVCFSCLFPVPVKVLNRVLSLGNLPALLHLLPWRHSRASQLPTVRFP